MVRKKQSRPVEPATEFADRVAPTKPVGTHVSSSKSLRGVQIVENGLECIRLEDVGSAASEGFAPVRRRVPTDNRDGARRESAGKRRGIQAE